MLDRKKIENGYRDYVATQTRAVLGLRELEKIGYTENHARTEKEILNSLSEAHNAMGAILREEIGKFNV